MASLNPLGTSQLPTNLGPAARGLDLGGFLGGPGGMIAGGLLSGLGGILGGSSQNRAGRQARDFQDKRTGEGYQRLWNLLYGPQSMHPGDFSKPGMGAPTPTGGSLLGRLSGLASWGQGQGNQIAGRYAADTGRLAALAGGAEDMAGRWGAGREKIIREDAGRQLTDMNDQSRAVLNSTGFGNSTAVTDRLAGNARQVGQQRDRSLQDLSESQIDRQLGARSQRLNVEGGRASGETGLLMNLLGQNIGLRQAPINVELGAAQSSIANPWLGQNTSSYFPGASGAGSALSNLGGGLASYGSFQAGQQNQQQLLQQLLSGMGRAS